VELASQSNLTLCVCDLVTRPRAGNRGSTPGRGRDIFLLHRIEALAFYSVGTRGSVSGGKVTIG
jgi:hypothetical protein